MKAPAFWYKPRGLTSCALAPLGLFWRAGTAIRRKLASPYRAKIPVICVGNIVAGGSGKTPTALALAQMLLEKNHRPVFVTRGYGGREYGPLRVDLLHHSVQDVGDEALLLARVAPVWIGHDRAAAIQEAEKHGTHIILDDGLQNPSIKPDVSLLVIDGATSIGNGCLIPAGPLRETLTSALKRATAVVLIGERDEQNLAARISCPVLRARLQPDFPADFPRAETFLAFAGIGHPEKFYDLCRRAGLMLLGGRDFPDHHVFTNAQRYALQRQAEAIGARLLTTEKDYVRLPPDFQRQVMVLPVRLAFDEAEMVMEMINKTGKINHE